MLCEWPADGLDVAALLRTGWRPVPFRQFVFKTAARCNLACDYCYMYEMADDSWRSLPRLMPEPVLGRAAERIAEHARTHCLKQVDVIFHGGEPLLAGTAALARAAQAVRSAVPAGTTVRFGTQTNGTLLDEAAVADLAAAAIRVGISVDGDQATHDRHRRDRQGAGSHYAAVRATRLLRTGPRPDLFAGVLCVVDLTADPIATYEALLELAPPTIDFLLPHGNWTMPPPGLDGEAHPYGSWLATVFDRWFGVAVQESAVRLFQEVIHLILGGRSNTEQIGLSPSTVLVVNTDGSLEQVDTLRSTRPGAQHTGLTVFANAFDDALHHPAVVARQLGVGALSDECLSCPVHPVCGAGHYAHRYRKGSGFRHPSVYCADLEYLIRHIANRLRADLAWRYRRST